VSDTSPEDYLKEEAKARVVIDQMLIAAGWAVQDYAKVVLNAARGVAVREFPMAPGHGTADYLLFIDGRAAGVIEAKRMGIPLIGVEWQSAKYTSGVPDAVKAHRTPLPFAYESTGVDTRFTNGLDPEPKSRRVFSFHRPDTLAAELARCAEGPGTATLRQRVHRMPMLIADNLWPAQETAILNLEASLTHDRPRALIQMATGSGKTFTAANISYRLVKHADAKRILFLVDRANLGRQTLKEFQQFATPDDGRKFTELYNVQHLDSDRIDPVARVTISTIQRLHAILKGEALPEELDELSGFDTAPEAPVEVSYNPSIPIEEFDVIIVDECHRSIYGVWRQVLEYFDAFLIGLTATPGKQTFGFFNQNLVMEYGHEQAVADGVNVDFDVYRIKTRITEEGSSIEAGMVTKFREKETRAERLVKLDQDFDYEGKDLDNKVVARDQIRTIIRAFRDRLPEIFEGRTEVPKTLIFAKSDAHADDITEIVREEFGKGNDFAAKITYKSGSQGQKPEDLLASFRNSYNPRIAVTVDMIATGTDVRPLECVFFMRMVKSRNYFEQMKGRGVRIINDNDLRAVTPDARAKDRFVLVDAVGVTETELMDSPPIERRAGVPLEKLLNQIALGNREPDVISSVASRIARLDAQITKADQDALADTAGVSMPELVKTMLAALDPDIRADAARAATGKAEPSDEDIARATEQLADKAVSVIADRPEFREHLVTIRRSIDQVIDEFSVDEVMTEGTGYSKEATDRARHTTQSFEAFIEENKDEITALQILYNQPYGAKELTFAQIKELAQAIERPPRRWTPEALWHAYETLDRSKVRGTPQHVLTDLISLVRFAVHQEDELVPYPEQVVDRYEAWLQQQREAGREFSDEQLVWLESIRDHVAASLGISMDDFAFAPFGSLGGIGKATELFGDELPVLLGELTQELVA
jgi:type I restriction enzyme R subunit